MAGSAEDQAIVSSAGAASSCRLMELDPGSPSPPPRPEAADADDGTVKLFGVALQGKKKKRAHREDGNEDHEQGSSEV